MATDQAKETLAKQLVERAELIDLWEQIKAGQTPHWERGEAFEYLIIRAFEMEGVQVRWPYHVILPQRIGIVEQIDGAINFQGRGFLIESKDQNRPKDIEPIAKLRLRLERRPPDTMGLIFSSAGFTTAAEVFAQFASPMNVLLWDGNDFEYALMYGKMTDALAYKMKYAIEEGLSQVFYQEVG